MSWYKTLRKKNCVDCGIEFETFRPGQKRCAPCGKKADRAAKAKFRAKKRAETEKKKAELKELPEPYRPKDPIDIIRERSVLEAQERIDREIAILNQHKLNENCQYAKAEKYLR